MTPDRDPQDRCPACDRSILTHLSFQEAASLYGYARTDCLICRLTDVPRPPANGR